MQAIVYEKYGAPEVLRVKEVERPRPRKNEVRVRIGASVVSATAVVFRGGRQPAARLFTGLFKPKNPILGDVLAGEVEAVDPDVTAFKVGDQVFGSTDGGFGAHTEYACLPEDGVLAIKPAGVAYAEAVALCDGGLTALPFMRDEARIRRGQTILINGASGSVGTLAVQLARHYGADVTGVCSTANLELVRSLGAERVIDYTSEDFTRLDDRYDVVFDAVGKSSFSRCKRLLRPGGIYLTTVLTPSILLQTLWTSRIGSKRAAIAFTGLRSAREKKRDLLALKELMEAGSVRPVVDRCYPLEQIAEAHRYVEAGHKRGSVVITLDGNHR